jgi:hypothetical protein
MFIPPGFPLLASLEQATLKCPHLARQGVALLGHPHISMVARGIRGVTACAFSHCSISSTLNNTFRPTFTWGIRRCEQYWRTVQGRKLYRAHNSWIVSITG